MTEQGPGSRLSALLAPIADLSLRREIVMVMLILAETMIVFIFGGTLLAERDAPFTPLPPMIIFAVLLIAYQIPHILETLRIWTPEYEIIMTTGLVATLLIVIKVGAFPEAGWFSTAWVEGSVNALILRDNESVRPVWMLVAFTVYAWWRGRSRAEPVLETSYSMLRLGLIWIAGGLVLAYLAVLPEAAIYDHINAAVIGFVVFSLLAVAVSRRPASRNASEWNAAWIWLVIFALPILAIAAVTISTVGVLTRDTLDLFLAILEPVFWLLAFMLRALVLLIAVIAFIVMSPVIWFVERQGFRPLANFPGIDLTPRNPADVEEFAQSTLDIADPIRYLVAGLIIAVLIWLLVRFAFRRRRTWEEGSRTQHDSLIEWEEGPSRLIGRVADWFARRFHGATTDPYPDDPLWDATRRVRRLYRYFLRSARKYQFPRAPGETPTQLAKRITVQHQGLGPEVNRITNSYNQARYSGKPVSSEIADQAQAALDIFQREIEQRSSSEPSS